MAAPASVEGSHAERGALVRQEAHARQDRRVALVVVERIHDVPDDVVAVDDVHHAANGEVHAVEPEPDGREQAAGDQQRGVLGLDAIFPLDDPNHGRRCGVVSTVVRGVHRRSLAPRLVVGWRVWRLRRGGRRSEGHADKTCRSNGSRRQAQSSMHGPIQARRVPGSRRYRFRVFTGTSRWASAARSPTRSGSDRRRPAGRSRGPG